MSYFETKTTLFGRLLQVSKMSERADRRVLNWRFCRKIKKYRII